VQLFDVALRACRTYRRLLELRAAAAGRGSSSSGTGRAPMPRSRQAEVRGGAAKGSAAAAAAAATAALEVASLRGDLAVAAAAWRSGRSYLLRILRNKALQLGGDDDVDALLGALGFNAYYAE